MKSSKILREARCFLRTGVRGELITNSLFICGALSDWCVITNEGKQHRVKVDLIKERINVRLEGRLTLNEWLKYKLPKGTRLATHKVQAHRLAWMELLALEYESEGD